MFKCLFIREMKIGYNYIVNRMGKIKKIYNIKVYWRCRLMDIIRYFCWECKLVKLVGKIVL